MSETGFSNTPRQSFYDRLLPAPLNGGFSMENYHIWGSSVIQGEDGRFHMFASQVPAFLPLPRHWCTHSLVVRAVSDTPEGPYKYQEVVLPRRERHFFDGMMTHNPRILKYKDTYYLYYLGTTYPFPLPEEPITREMYTQAWSNKRIGLATSPSVFGPWKRLDKPLLEPRPGKWDSLITTNPSPAVRKDGSTIMAYKSAVAHKPPLLLGVAGADHPGGPFKRLSDEPIFQFHLEGNDKHDVEDPFIWWNGNHYELIMKERAGHLTGEPGAGIHCTSADGIRWTITDPPMAYSRHVLWENGKRELMANFERPFLLFIDGKPTHLFAATGRGPKYWSFDKSWNMVIPLKS